MFGFLRVLKPIGIIVLKTVLKEIFNAEFLFGAEFGKTKLTHVLTSVENVVNDPELQKDLTVDLIEFINAVVEVLNQLGLLDDKPGVDVADPKALMNAILRAFKEAMDLLTHFQVDAA